jgi:hypothetical protein
MLSKFYFTSKRVFKNTEGLTILGRKIKTLLRKKAWRKALYHPLSTFSAHPCLWTHFSVFVTKAFGR